MKEHCLAYSNIYKDSLELSMKMFVKILKFLYRLLPYFEEMKRVNHFWHHYNFRDAGLAFDFEIGKYP